MLFILIALMGTNLFIEATPQGHTKIHMEMWLNKQSATSTEGFFFFNFISSTAKILTFSTVLIIFFYAKFSYLRSLLFLLFLSFSFMQSFHILIEIALQFVCKDPMSYWL